MSYKEQKPLENPVQQYETHFIALESDPQIFTDLMHKLGGHDSLKFVDVWSLDGVEMLSLPGPVLAMVLILPPCPAYDPNAPSCKQVSGHENGIVWFKQTINNACGLYAILHSVCNSPYAFTPGSFLDRLMAAKDGTEFLKDPENLKILRPIYKQAAESGSTPPPLEDAKMDHHYVCFVKHSDVLYELDGDRNGPMRRNSLKEMKGLLSSELIEAIETYTQSCVDDHYGLLALVHCT